MLGSLEATIYACQNLRQAPNTVSNAIRLCSSAQVIITAWPCAKQASQERDNPA